MRRCPISWTTRHVKGHQDDNAEAVLDRWALLNIEMDEKAKEHWRRTQQDGRQQSRIFGETWSVWIGAEKLTGNIRRAVTEQIHGKAAVAYWGSKGRFGNGSEEDIDWESTGKAMELESLSRQRWITKQVSGFCGTGVMMKRWKKRPSAACPRCTSEIEDIDHVWKCQGEDANLVWDKSIADLRQWLSKEKTHANLADVICDRLSAWRYDRVPTVNGSQLAGLQTTIILQDSVDWRAFFEGVPVKGWQEAQHGHYIALHSRKMGRRWLSALIKKLWQVAWDIWQHRNDTLHKKDNNILYAQQIQEIKDQFVLGKPGLTHDAKRLLTRGLHATLALSPALRAGWLLRVTRSRLRFARRQGERQARYSRERQIMARWLDSA